MEPIQFTPIQSAETLHACAATLVAAYNAAPWNDAWTHAKAHEKLLCFYQSPKFYGWTATRDGELLGCMVGNIEPYYSGDYFYLKEMFVAPQHQHQGIGRRFMEILRAHLAMLDIQTIILFTGMQHFPFEFYLKSGFVEMDGMRMMAAGPTE
jgi:GNAT superfamily N-acetyltransferase